MNRAAPQRSSQLWPGKKASAKSQAAKSHSLFLGYKVCDELKILARLASSKIARGSASVPPSEAARTMSE